MIKRMRIAAVMGLFCLVVVPLLARADSTEVSAVSSMIVDQARLTRSADGGCIAVVHANFNKNFVGVDGGAGVVNDSDAVSDELAGAEQTQCLNFLNNSARRIFRDKKRM